MSPLIQGNSRQAISHNIDTEEKAGKPHDQAVAIGLHTADRNGGVPQRGDPPHQNSPMSGGKDDHWMEKLHKGHLHQALGVKEGQKIPESMMQEALAGKHGPDVKRMAQAAKNMEHSNPNWHESAQAAPPSRGSRFANSMRGGPPPAMGGGEPDGDEAGMPGGPTMRPDGDGDEDDEQSAGPAKMGAGRFLRG